MAENFDETQVFKFDVLNTSTYNDTPIKDVFTKGDSYITGQSFEILQTNPLNNVIYILMEKNSNKVIDSKYSFNGSFTFDDLEDNTNYNIIAIDNSMKYNGKYINVNVEKDLVKSLKIVKLYEVKHGNNYEYCFKLFSNGNPQVSISGQEFLSVANINDIYKITGSTNLTTFTYTIYVDDYITGVNVINKTLEVTYKE